MKKEIVIAAMAILMTAAPAFAGWNLNIFGSDDHHKNNRNRSNRVSPVNPDNPVQPVPEPGTVLLLAAGLVGLAAWRKVKR